MGTGILSCIDGLIILLTGIHLFHGLDDVYIISLDDPKVKESENQGVGQ